jgi:hypothetical protein
LIGKLVELLVLSPYLLLKLLDYLVPLGYD